MIAFLVILASVPLFLLSGLLELDLWVRIMLVVIGIVILVIGISIACILDKDAGAFECPECKNRFVPDMFDYIIAPHTIKKRKLKCPKCGARKYCRKVLTKR